ncbi:uncharacterized protein METZ01_LOCUS242284, partial [marine metagenome]
VKETARLKRLTRVARALRQSHSLAIALDC